MESVLVGVKSLIDMVIWMAEIIKVAAEEEIAVKAEMEKKMMMVEWDAVSGEEIILDMGDDIATTRITVLPLHQTPWPRMIRTAIIIVNPAP